MKNLRNILFAAGILTLGVVSCKNNPEGSPADSEKVAKDTKPATKLSVKGNNHLFNEQDGIVDIEVDTDASDLDITTDEVKFSDGYIDLGMEGKIDPFKVVGPAEKVEAKFSEGQLHVKSDYKGEWKVVRILVQSGDLKDSAFVVVGDTLAM